MVDCAATDKENKTFDEYVWLVGCMAELGPGETIWMALQIASHDTKPL